MKRGHMIEYEFYVINEAVTDMQRHYILGNDEEIRQQVQAEKGGVRGIKRAEQAAAIIDAVIKSIDDIFNEIANTSDTGDTGKFEGLTQAAHFLQKNIKAALLTERTDDV